MSRLSLLMGLFLATTMTIIVMLLAIVNNASCNTLIYRGAVIFFIFGFLGTVFGSFLEIVLVPVLDERETEALKKQINSEDESLQKDLGDLLEYEDTLSRNQSEGGTPTSETRPGTAIDGSNSTVAS